MRKRYEVRVGQVTRPHTCAFPVSHVTTFYLVRLHRYDDFGEIPE